MAKKISVLTNMRRQEQYEQLKDLRDRDLCYMMRAHFESHPLLPGEKIIKDTVNQILALDDDGQNFLTNTEKDIFIHKYVNTRIRETSLKEGRSHFQNPLIFNFKESFGLSTEKSSAPVTVHIVDAELRSSESCNINVFAKLYDGGQCFVGTIPDNFIANNPMIVNQCPCELQIADYSNGKMKNISVRLVVDTDVMSNDAVELDDDMLRGITRDISLEQ